jgi:hypothetical protein
MNETNQTVQKAPDYLIEESKQIRPLGGVVTDDKHISMFTARRV